MSATFLQPELPAAAAGPATDPRALRPLGRIAVELPGATAVFRRLKLDFCCGGQAPLAQACAARGLDTEAVLRELAALERDGDTAVPQESAALVEHLLARFHAVHRQQLPELVRMARRVEAVHRGHATVPAGLADLLEQMHAEMLEHMAKEEEVLFPLMQGAADPATTVQPIGVMRHEHVAHGAQLERLAALTHDYRPPADACNTWRALYAGARQFADDLVEHIHLENNVLFPQFEAAGSCATCG
ncbi:MAG: iron-sulfur cluster repair protein YtfE [Rubrivivax sp.]|nr:iron-sulfur cluster repair protein YtfE [Rubrivivax sp.]